MKQKEYSIQTDRPELESQQLRISFNLSEFQVSHLKTGNTNTHFSFL